jgi:hypothetical protein
LGGPLYCHGENETGSPVSATAQMAQQRARALRLH